MANQRETVAELELKVRQCAPNGSQESDIKMEMLTRQVIFFLNSWLDFGDFFTNSWLDFDGL